MGPAKPSNQLQALGTAQRIMVPLPDKRDELTRLAIRLDAVICGHAPGACTVDQEAKSDNSLPT